jgi:hypothetical protein
MKSTLVLPFGLVCLAAGVVLGLSIVRRDSPPAPQRRSAAELPGSMPAAPVSAGPSVELDRLRERVRELEARPLSPPLDPEAGNRSAAELYDGLTNRKMQEEPAAWLRMLGRLGEMDRSMTTWCVKKYRESKPKVDAVALELAVRAGGPEAVALLKEILGSSHALPGDWATVGIVLSGQGMISRVGGGLQVDEELARLGERALARSDPWERMAGIGLLGCQDTDGSRAMLQSLVSQELNGPAKQAAIRALGRVGNRASLDFLGGYAVATFPPPKSAEDDEELTPLEATLRDAIGALRRRFPD